MVESCLCVRFVVCLFARHDQDQFNPNSITYCFTCCCCVDRSIFFVMPTQGWCHTIIAKAIPNDPMNIHLSNRTREEKRTSKAKQSIPIDSNRFQSNSNPIMVAAADKKDTTTPPPHHHPHHQPTLERRPSVRLSEGWMDDSVMAAIAQAVDQEQDQHGASQPLPFVAFFPLPMQDDEVPPPSPRSPRNRKVVSTSPGDAPPLVDLNVPSFEQQTLAATATAAPSTATDEASDVAKAAVQDLQSDTDFSSIGTVASREFSQHMADEIWEDVPMGPADAILGESSIESSSCLYIHVLMYR